MLKLNVVLLALSSFLVSPLLQAGEPSKEVMPTIVRTPFDKGANELQFGVGGMLSLNNGGTKRPELDDVGIYGRYGWMLSTPAGSGISRGNVEFLLDGGASAIVDGPGDILVEAALLLRYNFVQPNAKIVPYFQIGAGGEYSNASDTEGQRLIGSTFSFNLQSSIGIRFFCSERTAFYAETIYRHVSNASLADRNLGLNSVGEQIGFSWFF